MMYSDQPRSGRRNRFSTPQHTDTDSSMALMSIESSHRDTGGTSPFSVGKGLGPHMSTGLLGLSTGVWHSGQDWAVSSSSTPQLTQYDISSHL